MNDHDRCHSAETYTFHDSRNCSCVLPSNLSASALFTTDSSFLTMSQPKRLSRNSTVESETP